MDDLKIVKRIQDGNLDAFGTLYEAYIDKIYKFIYLKVSDREIAEDITAEVFLKAFDTIEKFRIDKNSSFKAWIYKIAYHKVVDSYRTKKESVNLEDVLHLWKSTDVHKLIDDKDLLQEVLTYLQDMKKEHRDVVFMRVWQWLSYKEISEISGQSVANCKKIFSRTCKKLNANFVLLLLIIITL